ncbi:MAG: hypothetical protein WED10_13435, partial [Brumimicrobium sp.]
SFVFGSKLFTAYLHFKDLIISIIFNDSLLKCKNSFSQFINTIDRKRNSIIFVRYEIGIHP